MTLLVLPLLLAGCGAASDGSSDGVTAVGPSVSVPAVTSNAATPDAATTPPPLMQASSSATGLTQSGSSAAPASTAPSEDEVRNGGITVPAACTWGSGDLPLRFTDGVAPLSDLGGEVLIEQTTSTMVDGAAYRVVDFQCLSGGNASVATITLYDASLTPVMVSDLREDGLGDQDYSRVPTSGTLVGIPNGFSVQWDGESMDGDGTCHACASGSGTADFTWDGGRFVVSNLSTWASGDGTTT